MNLIDPTGHSWLSKAFKAVGQFFTNLVEHPVQTILAIATVAVGVVTGNPFLIASGVVQFVNVGTSSWQGGGWSTFHQVAGYTATALAVAGAFYTPATAPSAELGYNSTTGAYVGTANVGTTLDPIIITKESVAAYRAAQFARAFSAGVAAVQTGLTIAGMVPGAGAGFDVANAGISAVRGDWAGAGLSMAATIPFVGLGTSAGRLGHAVIGKLDDLKSLRSGENSLLNHLSLDRGSPKLNWKQNSGALRVEMQKGLPIRDASPGIESGFLGAEKNLMRNHGWKPTQKGEDVWWFPPS